MNNTYFLKEYLPTRYNANAKQLADRQTCYNFKDGYLSDEVKNGFLEKLNTITQGDKATWSICFIPASSKLKTTIRYAKLSEAIQAAGYKVAMNAIHNVHDREAEHISGKTSNPIEGFGFSANGIAGKKVIVIDDIITRGTTYNQVTMKLQELGATSVTGLFLAKTINPDFTPYYANNDDIDDFDPADYYDEEEETFDNYNGSYAQDIEGWSDQDIDDVFDGDPEAYWNID